MKKFIINRSVMMILALMAFALSAVGERLRDKPGLVTTEWLAAHTAHPELRIIDAREGLRSYIQGHIPGAIYLNTETLRISEGGVPAKLLPPDELAEIFARLGIGNRHTVVIYSSGGETFAHATFVAFVLEWLGHQAIGVLDGGYEKWAAEGRPVTRRFPSFDRERFETSVDHALMRMAADVESAAEERSAVLLDARGPQLYAAGHIGSANNFFLEQTLEGDAVKTWKSPAELRRMAAAVEADGTRPIITYCTSGRESSQIWFTLRHVAGLPEVASYAGSLIDWISKGLPLTSEAEE